MFVRLIPHMFSCELLAITIAAWARLYQRRQGPQHALGLVAFGMVTANAVFAAATFLFYQFRPPSHLPPWQEPEILSLGFLFLLAPIGMILGIVAGVREASMWMICVVEIAWLPLFAVGLMAGAAV